MFDLEQAVNEWCKTVGVNRCRQKDKLNELQDHLHCEIENKIGQGHSEEQAFYLAIEEIGDASDLKNEYNKHRGKLDFICENTNEQFIEQVLQGKEKMDAKFIKKLMIGNSIIWAAAMIGAAILLKGTEQSFSIWLMMLGLWFASSTLFGGIKHSSKAECAYFKRKFAKSPSQ